jgi:hypothetical protein
MKPPLKPFTVEVKRSRSSSAFAKPVVSTPPVLTEASAAPAPLSLSQARQAAEQMFGSLTAGSSLDPETRMTAESVFKEGARRVLVAEKPAAGAAAHELAVLAPTAKDVAQVKPRTPHAGEVRTAPARVNKAVKTKAPDMVQAATRRAPPSLHQDVRTDVSEVSLGPVELEQRGHLLAAEDGREERENWGWGPGERWKRRLRHLR